MTEMLIQGSPELRQQMWDKLNQDDSKDDLENPNSFVNVSLDPRNRNSWIGVRYLTLAIGLRISDAKWVDPDRNFIVREMLSAQDLSASDSYYLYSPMHNEGARYTRWIRGPKIFRIIPEYMI